MWVAIGDYIGVSVFSLAHSEMSRRLYPSYIYVHNNTQEDFYEIARFPSVLEAIDGTHILMQSPTNCEKGNYGNRWLLGDSEYPCKPYHITSLLNPVSYNGVNYKRAHIDIRSHIERCFGVWKRRFSILSLEMRLCLETTQAAVIATAVLHNICRRMSLEDQELEIENPEHNLNITYANIPKNHIANEISEVQ